MHATLFQSGTRTMPFPALRRALWETRWWPKSQRRPQPPSCSRREVGHLTAAPLHRNRSSSQDPVQVKAPTLVSEGASSTRIVNIASLGFLQAVTSLMGGSHVGTRIKVTCRHPVPLWPKAQLCGQVGRRHRGSLFTEPPPLLLVTSFYSSKTQRTGENKKDKGGEDDKLSRKSIGN